jgi:hypothetical protein
MGYRPDLSGVVGALVATALLIVLGIVVASERLSLTEGTVKNYISAILAKTGLHDRTQAALLAVRQGLID